MAVLNELHITVRDNFHSDDFEFVQAEKKIRLKPKEIESYVLTQTNIARVNASKSEERRKLQVKGGFGLIHLDFTPTATTGKLFDLPANSPTPTSLIENQTFSGGVIWIDKGSRQIHSSGLQANSRVVLDLVGFFE